MKLSNNYIKRFLWLFTFVVISHSCFSQGLFNNNYIIQKRFLSVEDGLPSREVFCTLKDKTGFMWIGTGNGLCRYDGKSFKIFTKQKDGLYGNIIDHLTIDDSNRLYIYYRLSNVSNKNFGNENEDKFQVLDLNTYTFKSLSAALPVMPFDSKNIEIIEHGNSGYLYFITSSPYKVWKYNVKKGFQFLGSLNKWDNQKIISGCFFSDFYHYSIVQNGFGVFSLIRHATQYFISPDTLFAFNSKNPTDVFLSVDRNKGIEMYHSFQSQDEENVFYNENIIKMKTLPDREGIHLLNSFAKKKNIHCIPNSGESDGSFIVHAVNESVYLFKDHQLILLIDKAEIKNNGDLAVTSYYQDQSGNIWLTTSLGLFKINLKKKHFNHITITDQPFGKTGYQVRGIYVEGDTVKKESLNIKNLYASFWYSFLHQSNGFKHSFTTNNDLLYAVLKHHDKIYVGGTNLYTYDSQKNSLHLEDSVKAGEIWSMTSLCDSIILLGCTNYFYKYNIITHKGELINFKTNGYPQPRNIYRFLNTKKMGLTAVAENGLYVINSTGKIVDYYGNTATEKSHQLPNYCIWDIHEDQQGFCWLATNGDGLIRWDWNAPHPNDPRNFRKFDVDQGLPSNILYRIEEDQKKNLWISSYYGLIRFNENSFAVNTYFINDGLSNNDFNRSSSFKSASGKIYFGGMNGINVFNPEEINETFKMVNFPFELIGFKKFSENKNSSLDCLSEFKSQQKITLEPNDKYLSVDFILLDYKDRHYQYAYKIEGLNKDWNLINENNIQISGLPHGNYNLIIKAQLESGEWNNVEIKIPITVLVPFYLNKYFILIFILLIILSIFLIIRFRSLKLKKDNKRLENKVQDRTQSLVQVLNEKDVLLSEKNLLLTEVHHRIKNNLQVINGLLELRKSTFKDKKFVTAFNEGQSSVISIAMIHELLYQNESFGSLRFTIIAKNITNVISKLFATQKKYIDFEFGNSEIELNIDTAVPLGLILNELLTNAYKYLPINTNNKVFIDLIDLRNGKYEFTFQDNGPGLNADLDFEKITSIGLSIVKRLTTQLEGEIHYEFNHGAKFVIIFSLQ